MTEIQQSINGGDEKSKNAMDMFVANVELILTLKSITSNRTTSIVFLLLTLTMVSHSVETAMLV